MSRSRLTAPLRDAGRAAGAAPAAHAGPAARASRATRAEAVTSSLAALPVPILIGALLRVPAQAIQRRLIAGLNAVGFPELRLPHMAVLQYPGPDGCRPFELARRAGMSKQAMNQLLKSLEQHGYVSREDADDDLRARRVHLTKRGRAVWDRMIELLEAIEAEWRRTLGERRFAQLKALLGDVWALDLSRATEPATQPAPRRRAG
jgi:DNA-binding MarR family transcriptional regulator